MTAPTSGPATEILTVQTPVGPARVHLARPATLVSSAHGWLVLGHGAGPNVGTVDLTTTVMAAIEAGWVVALVEQPWLVAGRQVAARPAVLDEAWVSVVQTLGSTSGATASGTSGALGPPRGPLVVAGRSAGARVACRTALHLGASGVLALSFPLHPPGKSQSSRAAELGLPLTGGLPVHVIQGARDPFGNPAQVAAAAPGLAGLYAVPGTHTIPQGSATAVATAVRQALRGIQDWARRELRE